METRETITLDARAQQRLYVLNHLLTRGLTAEEAARVLGLSVRQVRRLLRRYRDDGSAGLVHGNRERTPAHRIPDAIRERVVELATTTYAGVNHSHLAELLAEREDLDLAPRTLRPILAEDRLVSELRLAGITNIEDANAFLPGFLERYAGHPVLITRGGGVTLDVAGDRFTGRLRGQIHWPATAQS